MTLRQVSRTKLYVCEDCGLRTDNPDHSQYCALGQGVGSVLGSMLAKLGIQKTEDCGCGNMQVRMNRRGPDWCEENRDRILDHLKMEARRRKLPYSRRLASLMLTRAIGKHRKFQNDTSRN